MPKKQQITRTAGYNIKAAEGPSLQVQDGGREKDLQHNGRHTMGSSIAPVALAFPLPLPFVAACSEA
jgi:hypothetical protein